MHLIGNTVGTVDGNGEGLVGDCDVGVEDGVASSGVRRGEGTSVVGLLVGCNVVGTRGSRVAVGADDGTTDGGVVRTGIRRLFGERVGVALGCAEGDLDGEREGEAVSEVVGIAEVTDVGGRTGRDVGAPVGYNNS